MGLLHEDQEPTEWKELHVGPERRTNCEHMQASLTSILQRDAWVMGLFRYQTAFVVSLDVRTAFNVTKSSVVSQILTFTGTQTRYVSTFRRRLSDVQDVFDRVRFRLQCCGEEWPNTYCGKLSDNGRSRDGESRSEEKETMNNYSVV